MDSFVPQPAGAPTSEVVPNQNTGDDHTSLTAIANTFKDIVSQMIYQISQENRATLQEVVKLMRVEEP